MSKIGNLPITIPQGVTVTTDHRQITVTGPKGSLTQPTLPGISLEQTDGQVRLTRTNDAGKFRAAHGLLRVLVSNMVTGVSTGWQKNLELVGTGYRAAPQGTNLSLNVGYSHPVVITAPAGITFKVDGQTKVTVSGTDKHVVGQVSAKIRAVRPPEPYKGKGIRYEGEKVRRKAGKAASSGAK